MLPDDIHARMRSGELYDPTDPRLMAEQSARIGELQRFNATRPTPRGYRRRARLLGKMFAEIGEGCYIEPPLRASWGGMNVHFGSHIYCNFNLTLIDDADIHIGSRTLIGPNVSIVTAAHPVLPELRRSGLEFNLPIHIGENCWIGAGVVVLPGVTIGDDSVVGAGSIVTKDVPAGVVAFGNPCRVQRAIGEHDREFYFRDLRIPPDLLEG